MEANARILLAAGRAPVRRLLAVALVAIMLVLGLNAAAARAASDGPYAIHSMLQLNSPYGFKQVMFAEAAKAGASEIRVDASLGALNNQWISTAMWQGLQDYMQLSQQYSLPVLLDLNASNDISLETCQSGIDPSTGLCGVTNLTGYYNEVAALVRYTRGVIDDFEVVNEPDGSWAFTGTPQQYAGMLATAYQAVHDNDPNGRVLLGGMMSLSDTGWLAQVFTTPGFDAAHKFDVANVHLRDSLADLPGDVIAWRKFFTFFGDGNLPLWVTEAGYPADPAWQYDSTYRGTDAWSGLRQQAAFLTKALPVMLYAGAARVFVTERDDLSYEYASEGLLGGGVTDADENNPSPVERPSFNAFAALVAQWQAAPTPPQPLAYVPPPAPDPTPPTTPSSPAAGSTPGPGTTPTPGTTPSTGATQATGTTPRPSSHPTTTPAQPAAKGPAPKRPTPKKPAPKGRAPKKRAHKKPTPGRHAPKKPQLTRHVRVPEPIAHMARTPPRH